MSQMPDVAGSWPEEGTQYLSGAPMEPVQQPYPQQAQYQQQQPYPQQGYGEQQQYGQPQYGAPRQQQYPAQPSYPQQQGYQEQPVQQQAMFAEEEQASVPSEFDHLFRDSSPGDRRSITGRAPVVSGPGAAASPGFPQQQSQAATQQAQAAQGTAVYNPGQPPQGFEAGVPEYGGNQSYDGGGGYGQGGGPGGFGQGRRRAPLVIGAAVVVVAAVGLYLGLSGGGSGSGGAPKAAGPTASASQTSNETAQQQASAVWALVQRSEQLRSDIEAEVGDLNSCSNASSLQSEISNTASQRQAQADEVAKLPVGKISDGHELASDLQAAWSASAESDNDYAKVAGDVAGGCSKSAVRSDPNESSADQASNRASTDKYRAAQLWNQTMTNYGQQQISQSDL